MPEIKMYPSPRVVGAFIYKGAIDASGNPNYPSAVQGDTYVISVAGKIGGASGVSVTVGDTIFAKADNAGGTQAGVGSSWDVVEANLDAAALGSLINSATSKTTPVDADVIALSDSAASNVLKKLSWANIKATLKSYFDGLYPSGSGTSTGSNTGDQSLAGLMPIPLYLSSNEDAGGTNFTAILSQTVVSDHAYTFRIEVPVTADAVGGLKVGVFLDADPSTLEAQIEIINNTAQTLAATKRITAKADTGTPATYLSVTGATSYFVRVWGTIINPSGTVLALAFAQAAATGTTSALKGATSQMSDLGSV